MKSPPTSSATAAAGLVRRSVQRRFIGAISGPQTAATGCDFSLWFRPAASEPLRAGTTVCPGRGWFGSGLGLVARFEVTHRQEAQLVAGGRVDDVAGLDPDEEGDVVAVVEPVEHRAGHPALDPVKDGHAARPRPPPAALELVDLVAGRA